MAHHIPAVFDAQEKRQQNCGDKRQAHCRARHARAVAGAAGRVRAHVGVAAEFCRRAGLNPLLASTKGGLAIVSASGGQSLRERGL